MRVLDNPYFHWGPIRDQRYFYGREEETRRILEAVNHGQCVSLVGPHKTGKTSLLFHLKALNQGVSSNEGTDHVYVYIDGGAHRKSRPSALYSEALHGIDEVLAAQDRSVQPMEEPKDGMDLADLWRAFSSLIRRGIGPVILIDEFDVFCENQSYGLDFFSGLRSLATRGVVYVTASKRTLFQLNREKEILGSPFFNYFKTLHVGLFDDESTLRLIRGPSAECGVQFDERMVTEILRLAGRHPFLSQQVCHIAFDMRRGQKGASSEQDLEQVRIRSRQELEEQMAGYWDGLELEAQQALFGVATGTASRQVSEVTLENLVRQCLLVRANGDFHIFSTLFEDYVRNQTRLTRPREQRWLDRFQDWEELGRGATSIVYKAYQPALDRYVAIKELIPQADLLDEDTERFRREARSIAHLDHPNILPVYDFYPEVDRAYIVMKYAAAGSLADRLNKTKPPFDPAKAVQITIYIGHALACAHRQEVIHRDIKPANIFMGEDDWPLLGDFGLALTKGESPIDEAGMTGSCDCISPEQTVDARSTDARSDIYSLGLVLYHLLVGEVPYAEEADPVNRLVKRLTQGVPSPRLRNPRISLEMELVVRKATASNPSGRYQTAEEMVEEMEDIIQKATASEAHGGHPKAKGMSALRTITWLHLSDLHFRASDAYDENIVLKPFLHDVEERINKDGLQPDLIIISGDIASASRLEEYALARTFLDDLLATTGLPKGRLFLVPGNHDVDRSAITTLSAGATAVLDSRRAINRLLASEDDRALVFQRFRSYRDFVNEYLGEDHIPFDHTCYFYVKEIEVANRRVVIIGLNSAWLAASDDDRHKLLLGERQVRAALDARGDAGLCLAVMHHPFDWLRDFDRNDVEPLLCKGCDFVLHGHMHQAGLQQIRTPDTEVTIIPAGACYETREYPNSYNFVQLNLGTGTGTVYFRTYSDRRGGLWTKDVTNYEQAPDGVYSFQLSERLRRSLEGTEGGAVAPVSGGGRQTNPPDEVSGGGYSIRIGNDQSVISGSEVQVQVSRNLQDKPRPVSGQVGYIPRLLTGALVVVVVFAVTIAVLVWAAQRVSSAALVLVLVVAVIFDLVSTVSVLVLAGVIRPKWAVDFYNAVLKKVPMLPVPSYLQPGPVSAETEELSSLGDEIGQGE